MKELIYDLIAHCSDIEILVDHRVALQDAECESLVVVLAYPENDLKIIKEVCERYNLDHSIVPISSDTYRIVT